ncbi:helix-turn-helix domain-containing protein [Microtetraspora malaysiensis]|uniref:Helix-turn-helix domain-containing protein n=1 Tax=Microtetraspora malaysiensis TaxID=161358 RepID=A0ABW6T8N1_9ACTN
MSRPRRTGRSPRCPRARSWSGAELATLRRLVDEGVSVTEAARILKLSRSTAYAALAANQ